MGLAFERVRDFLLLHYVANQRDKGDLWLHFQNLKLPDSLDERLTAWLTRGHIIAYEFGTFLPSSWLAVLLGQNLMPRGYDPRVRKIADDRLQAEARRIRGAVQVAVDKTPEHADFIRQIGGDSGRAPLMAGMI